MKLLIATCCYNELRFVEETVNAIVENTDVEYRLVLVNNNPPYPAYREGLWEIVDKAKRNEFCHSIWVLDRGVNLGCHGGLDLAWGEGGNLSNPDYYAKVDDDTVPPAGWATTLINTLESDQRFAFLAADNTAAQGRPDSARNRMMTAPNGVEVELQAGWLSCSCAIFRGSFWREVGPFNFDGLYGGEEHQIVERALNRGLILGYVPSVVAKHGDADSRPFYTVWKLAHAIMGWQYTFEEMMASEESKRICIGLYRQFFLNQGAEVPLKIPEGY